MIFTVFNLVRLLPGSARRRRLPYERDADPQPNRDKVERSLAAFQRLFPGVHSLRIERS